MKKDHLIIAALALTLIGVGISTAYLARSNSKLQANLLEMQSDSEERIQALEEEIERSSKEVEGASSLSLQELMAAVDNQDQEIENPETQTAPQIISETDLLQNYFADTPLVATTETEDQNPENEVVDGPVLKVEPEVFELGEISKQDGIATATFDLKNEGTSDLTITYAFTSCGCTLAPLDEEVTLKPGESYPLQVTYDPNFYGPNYELGEIEKNVTILSNYSRDSFKKVSIKANVIP